MKAYKMHLLCLFILLLASCDGDAEPSILTPTNTATATATINTPTLIPPTNKAVSPKETPTEPVADAPTVPPTEPADTPTATPLPPTPTLPQPTATETVVTNTPPPGSPTPVDQCHLTAFDDVTIFSRPDSAAAVFGTLAAGDSVIVQVMTSNVWFGFDPGVAQAPNVGPFRYRCIPTSPAVILVAQKRP